MPKGGKGLLKGIPTTEQQAETRARFGRERRTGWRLSTKESWLGEAQGAEETPYVFNNDLKRSRRKG